MSKRTTKADRVAAEKAALRYELELLAIGAYGSTNVEDEPENGLFLYSTVGCEVFGRWLDAIRSRWQIGYDSSSANLERWYILMPHNLKHFEGLESATEFLHEHGARAGGKWNG